MNKGYFGGGGGGEMLDKFLYLVYSIHNLEIQEGVLKFVVLHLHNLLMTIRIKYRR